MRTPWPSGQPDPDAGRAVAARHPGDDQLRPAQPFPVHARRKRGQQRFLAVARTLGFAAIGDAALTRNFGDIARRSIAPSASPKRFRRRPISRPSRAARINGTFGEDADLARAQVHISKASRAAATASRPRASSPSSSTGPDTARRNSASTATITTAAMRPIRATISPIT